MFCIPHFQRYCYILDRQNYLSLILITLGGLDPVTSHAVMIGVQSNFSDFNNQKFLSRELSKSALWTYFFLNHYSDKKQTYFMMRIVSRSLTIHWPLVYWNRPCDRSRMTRKFKVYNPKQKVVVNRKLTLIVIGYS